MTILQKKLIFRLIILLLFYLANCQSIIDKIWDKGFYWIGGHHKQTLTDVLKNQNICSEGADGEDCYGLLLLNYILIDYSSYAVIQIKNSSNYSSLTVTFRDQIKTVSASEISKKITLYYDPVGQYKITTTENGTVFNNSNYNFRTGTFNDGVIIRTDGMLVNDLALDGCNVFDVTQGKIIQETCLTPTNP